MDPQIWQDLARFRPEIILSASFLAVVLVDISWPRAPRATLWVAAAGLAAAFVASLGLIDAPEGGLFFGIFTRYLQNIARSTRRRTGCVLGWAEGGPGVSFAHARQLAHRDRR